MGNTNEVVASYVNQEELNRIRELELREKLKKQKLKIKHMDLIFYNIEWNKSLFRNGGYGRNLHYFPDAKRNDDKYTSLTIIYLVRALYHWYSNSKC